jgi:hypothetical protein
MKTIFWKIGYAFQIRKLLEDLGDDINIWSPRQAAEEDRDEWLASC